MENYQDKARGMLLGLAIGDALGAPIEFGYTSDTIRQLGSKLEFFTDSPRGNKGEWTDDTSMALCIADSLLEKKGYDSYDIMNKFVRWADYGYRSADNKPATDIGNQTKKALDDYKKYPSIARDEIETDQAGNAPIMRLAPIIIANTYVEKKPITLREAFRSGKLAISPEKPEGEFITPEAITPTLKMAELSARETHNSLAANAVTEMFASMLYCAMHGLEKVNIAGYCARWIIKDEYDQFYTQNSEQLINRALNPDDSQLRDLGGYIVDTFTISLWGLIHGESFKDGMLKVLQLGGDTDTNAACYGQIAGALYGLNSIPIEWVSGVYESKEITELADKLLAMTECPIIRTRFEDDEHFEELK